jgi:hypothetical protein
MRFLLIISLLLMLGSAGAESVRVLVQNSPLAGSQYYAASEMWLAMKVGDALELIREPDNRHDRNAIRVEWRGHKLGYVPRAENRAVAAAMDPATNWWRACPVLTEHANPWRRVEFEVFAEL